MLVRFTKLFLPSIVLITSFSTAATADIHKPAGASVVKSAIDPRARALLSTVDQTMANLPALSATIRTDIINRATADDAPDVTPLESVVKLMRPSYALVETYSLDDPTSKHPVKTERSLTASDGTQVWEIPDFTAKTYSCQQVLSPVDVTLDPDQLAVLSTFFGSSWLAEFEKSSDEQVSATYKDGIVWKGAKYKVVAIKQDYDNKKVKLSTTRTLYIGDDNLVHRLIITNLMDGSTSSLDSWIVALDSHPKLTKSDFAYTPPVGMKLAAQL
jgi:hypothetical protein